MSSVTEIKNKIATLKAEFRFTKNENTKLSILKKLDNLNKELNVALDEEKRKSKLKDQVLESEKQKEGFKDESIDKRPNNHKDINRGKVSEPNNNFTEKKEDKKN